MSRLTDELQANTPPDAAAARKRARAVVLGALADQPVETSRRRRLRAVAPLAGEMAWFSAPAPLPRPLRRTVCATGSETF